MDTKMKAAIRRNYCSPDQIQVEEIVQASLLENEILIKVHATTVNRTDCANLTAKPFIMRFVLGLLKPRQAILGTDFAGEVLQVGKKVNTVKIGDQVMGFNDTDLGSQTEMILVKEEDIHPIPEGINFNKAVASLEGAHYAYSFIQKVNIQTGQKIFINGATGAIGNALLQFVRQYDVYITVTCNTKNIELIKSLGADKIIDYTKEDFTLSTEKYDYIFDAVGKSTFGKCKSILKENGVYISSELGPYSQNIFYSLFTPIFGKKKVKFPIPYPTKESIPFIIKHLKDETFDPVIDRTYPLEEVREAYQYVIAGQKTGNVILSMTE